MGGSGCLPCFLGIGRYLESWRTDWATVQAKSIRGCGEISKIRFRQSEVVLYLM